LIEKSAEYIEIRKEIWTSRKGNRLFKNSPGIISQVLQSPIQPNMSELKLFKYQK